MNATIENLTASTIEFHRSEISAAWNAGNAAGNGYEIGEEGDDNETSLGSAYVGTAGQLAAHVRPLMAQLMAEASGSC